MNMKLTVRKRFLVIGSILIILASAARLWVRYEPLRERVWMIEGYATSTRTDLNLHKMSPGMMRLGARQLQVYSTVFWSHDRSRPIGRIVRAANYGDCIFVKIEICKDEKKLWERIRGGFITGLSTGTCVFEETPDWDNDMRQLIEVIEHGWILEVSLVYVPANFDARITRWYVELR